MRAGTLRAMGLVTAVAAASWCAHPIDAAAAGSTMWGSNHLLHLMDTNRDGVVSRAEFSHFMNRTFERLDSDRSGMLEDGELRRFDGKLRRTSHHR